MESKTLDFTGLKIPRDYIIKKEELFMIKEEMLEIMKKNNWSGADELDEDSSYEEVKEEYDEMIDEYDDSDMFPNGRDYDAEDEDGI